MIHFCILLLCLVSPDYWILSDTAPDSLMFEESLTASPVETILFMARTGWIPKWYSEEDITMIFEDTYPSNEWQIAFCSWLLRVPVGNMHPSWEVEYGIDRVENAFFSSDLLESALRRVLHDMAEGFETEIPAEVLQSMADNWDELPKHTHELILEVLGKMRINITNLLTPEEIMIAGDCTAARYFGEIGYEYDLPGRALWPPLLAVYSAGCTPADELEEYLMSEFWVVRYTAVKRCDASLLEALLTDFVPYVALEAAARRRDAGFEDGDVRIRELSELDGPVGIKAVEELSASDQQFLLRFMDDESPAKRFAAQSVWLSNQLPVSHELEQKWISDSYWLMPVQWVYEVFNRSESTHAKEIIAAMWDNLDNYSDPDAVSENISYLETMLYNETADDYFEMEEYLGWNYVSLPFNPDTVTVPDEVLIETDAGYFTLELWRDFAPITCASFCYLAGNGFYDGIYFHRVIPGFVAQAGCPEGNGMGGPGYVIPNERNMMGFDRGTVGMADAGLDTGGSQFFIMLDAHGRLDGRYTAFGQIMNSEELDGIAIGTIIERITPIF